VSDGSLALILTALVLCAQVGSFSRSASLVGGELGSRAALKAKRK
jgi:hypothetical protein